MAGECAVNDCRTPRHARDWCEMHYTRWRRNGTTDRVRRPACGVPGCPRPHSARGWCGAHYELWRRTGNTAPRPPRLCGVDGCGRDHEARGWCKTHYEQVRLHGRITNAVIRVRVPQIPSPLPAVEVARLRRAVGLDQSRLSAA